MWLERVSSLVIMTRKKTEFNKIVTGVLRFPPFPLLPLPTSPRFPWNCWTEDKRGAGAIIEIIYIINKCNKNHSFYTLISVLSFFFSFLPSKHNCIWFRKLTLAWWWVTNLFALFMSIVLFSISSGKNEIKSLFQGLRSVEKNRRQYIQKLCSMIRRTHKNFTEPEEKNKRTHKNQDFRKDSEIQYEFSSPCVYTSHFFNSHVGFLTAVLQTLTSKSLATHKKRKKKHTKQWTTTIFSVLL